MKTLTREKFNGYLNQQHNLNGVPPNTEQFSVVPSVQQTLEDKAREMSDLLQRINVIGVDEMEGEKLGLSIGSTIASRTDTSGNASRVTSDLSGLASRKFRCEKTNFDTHMAYVKLDTWAKSPDFQSRVSNQIIAQGTHDRIIIGWHGTSVAANTDRANNQLLQDVNKGWLEHLREQNADNVFSGIKVGSESGHSFTNIDAAVFDAISALAPYFRDGTDLVVISGRTLLTDKYLGLIQGHDRPSERNALEVIMANKQIGGLPTYRVPHFPENAFLITSFDNLSLYYQIGARRRMIKDVPERDRIETYESTNDAYVIEDVEKAVLVEGILTPDGSGGWA